MSSSTVVTGIEFERLAEDVESDETVTLGSLIKALDDGVVDSDILTGEVVEEIMRTAPDLARAYLRPAVYAQVHAIRRFATLAVEKIVDEEIRVGVDPSAARKKLAAECFYIPSSGMIPWLEATAEQHLERAERQRARAVPLLEDAQRHERAARDIREAGANCLADLDVRKTNKARKVS